ncbi:hypothetical protein EMCG_07991 [[Emmonsia] crescens]|uniref:Uncharacterized protein n=1 Tax=[Emmonsia] crescens TaxID=73230 RepID=A0A0G2JAT3_9EURO|nr:hypothetical protein EMCG_07991 [Emmonsia crescens UAMH 3008]
MAQFLIIPSVLLDRSSKRGPFSSELLPALDCLSLFETSRESRDSLTGLDKKGNKVQPGHEPDMATSTAGHVISVLQGLPTEGSENSGDFAHAPRDTKHRRSLVEFSVESVKVGVKLPINDNLPT